MSKVSEGTSSYGPWPYLAYPLITTAALVLFYGLKDLHLPLWFFTNAPIVVAAVLIALAEKFMPYRAEWTGDRGDYANDATFMVIVQMLLPPLLGFVIVYSIFLAIQSLGWHLSPDDLVQFWPHDWDIAAQAALILVLADFPRYWLHRYSHRINLLWSFHAVHHSSQKLYWLNVNRFHPVDKALQFLVDGLPFILLGVHQDVLALYFVFYAVNGFFQHCNIELRMGFLNYILAGPELHRWHHSKDFGESNTNYGNKIILWDLVFGTFYYPKNRQVGDLGLENRNYPMGFLSQLLAPFSGPIDHKALPQPTWTGWLLNGLLTARMQLIRLGPYRSLKRAAARPEAAQGRVLAAILQRNQDTEFGRAHGFSRIRDVAGFRSQVPVHDYEALRPLIERQERTRGPVLTSSLPFMYNQTSGTTGLPKLVPVVNESWKALRRSQKIASYLQYRSCPEGFKGKVLGLVSPAEEGRLETGTPFGSASGRIYATMPGIVRSKYVLPPEVFTIQDYETKYQVIARLALAERDITCLASANPSTFHKLLTVIHDGLPELLNDLAAGTCRPLDSLDSHVADTLRKVLKPQPRRAEELRPLLSSATPPTLADLWPCIRLVGTWTGGSCGVPLRSLLQGLPAGTVIIDVGYLASETRGTITLEARTNQGLPNLQEAFFEFVAKDDREAGSLGFVPLSDLKVGEEYYVFVTTAAGLYRYDMNDIVRVADRFRQTPTLTFVRKGRGMTNITGEKLAENQIIQAVEGVGPSLGLRLGHYFMLAYEEPARYELFVEFAGPVPEFDTGAFAAELDAALQEQNVEYTAKRQSGRLHPPRVHVLRPRTAEAYKKHCLSRGLREGQFKPAVLHYAKDLTFDLEGCRL